MSRITVKDGTGIYYKDWGTGQPLVFHHGWPLSGDDWDAQMMFFLNQGFRVIAHDRRGHGRSDQTAEGNDMDTYAADVAELVQALDLRDAVHIGHSTGGGEVIRYVARHGQGRVAKAVLISAVTPLMVQTDNNPDGIPMSVFDEIREGTATKRPQYFRDFTIPFYGYNRDGAKVSQGIMDNWWRQGMMGGAKAHYDCIKAFSETDFTEDLKHAGVPVLVMHGEDDQIVPFGLTGARAVKLLKARQAHLVSGLSSWYAGNGSCYHQRRPPGIYQILIRECFSPMLSQAFPAAAFFCHWGADFELSLKPRGITLNAWSPAF